MFVSFVDLVVEGIFGETPDTIFSTCSKVKSPLGPLFSPHSFISKIGLSLHSLALTFDVFFTDHHFAFPVAFPSSIYSNLGTSSSACNLGYLLREDLTSVMRNGYVFLFRKESRLLWLISTQRESLVHDS